MKQLLYIRRVAGKSMLPTYKPGQLVLFSAVAKKRDGDVVLLLHNGLEKIKRIAKLEGNKAFVLGDNPAESTDSRMFGWLPSDQIVAGVLWPRRRKP